MAGNNYKKETVQVNDIQMAYHITDFREGTPWLLLHGTRDTKKVWDVFFDQYGDDHYLVALDMRGHGDSGKPDVPYSFDLFIEDLKRFCEVMEFDTVNIMGHSLGGGMAMYLTVKHPQLVGKLVLMGCAASHKLDFKPKTDGKSHGDIISQILPFFFPMERKIVPTPIVEYVQKEITTGWVENITPVTHKRLNELARVDMTELVKEIQCPTLLVFGELDGVAKLSAGEFLAENIPDSKLEIIEDTGHFMFMERPQEVFSVIDEFI